jgi:hypothetical protein
MDDREEMPAGAQPNLFAGLHEELREAHLALVAALGEMEAVTRDGAADRLRYSRARWRLSNASLARRALWQGVPRALGDCALDADARIIAGLQQTDLAMLRASADHIRTWTAATVEERWAEYCMASRDIRWKMKAAISAEQRLLCPLLLRFSHASRRGPRADAA